MAIKNPDTMVDVEYRALKKLLLYDEENSPIPFSRLFEAQLTRHAAKDQKTKPERVLIIFIRHFFCGLCQEYLRRLSENSVFSETTLARLNTKLVIVGCGAPSLIQSYRSGIGLPQSWSMYADPTLRLFAALNMHRSYSLGDQAPDYVQQSTIRNMLGSVAQAIRRLSEGDVFSAGDWNIQGGEFLFELDTDAPRRNWNIVWNHRMAHSRDHTEVEELAKIIDLSTTKLQIMEEERQSHLSTTPRSSVSQKRFSLAEYGKQHESLHRRWSVRRYIVGHRPLKITAASG